jgi:hypothetical protein
MQKTSENLGDGRTEGRKIQTKTHLANTVPDVSKPVPIVHVPFSHKPIQPWTFWSHGFLLGLQLRSPITNCGKYVLSAAMPLYDADSARHCN